MNMQQNVTEYLKERYGISRNTQEQAKVTFDLTESEHLALWETKPKFLSKLAAKLAKNRASADSYMRSEFGPCLSWVNKQAKKGGVMNRHTAEVISHKDSQKRFRMQLGESHSEKSKRKISESKKGVKHTSAHKAKVSAALAGVPKSPESNSKRSSAMRAHWDKKRAEKAASVTQVVREVAEEQEASLNSVVATNQIPPH